MPQTLAILGSTGSIGSQTLDIIDRYPEKFRVGVLVAGNNIDLLIRQARHHRPDVVITGNSRHYRKLRDELSNTPTEVLAGEEAIEQVVASESIDVVVASIVGYSGLRPTISAVKAGKKIALANKETLVVAGELIGDLAGKTGSHIIPVDSEHSAILQCLAGEEGNEIEKITLTASGGPFINLSMDELREVKPQQALKHPNWDMGCKVTIDSASLMNKGLEVIEAKWLFNLSPDQISVIIHPQSVIHSFVHFADGSVKAQLGVPDMRIPILYALTYPGRIKSDLPRLDFNNYSSLSFGEPDTERFQNLRLAFDALRAGGNMCCILNAANEVAVNAFLTERIGFMSMPAVVKHAMDSNLFSTSADLDLLEFTDKQTRRIAEDYINKQ